MGHVHFCFLITVCVDRDQMIEKLGNVLGIDRSKLKNPDDSYVLTVDNVMKMLAIHMRFR